MRGTYSRRRIEASARGVLRVSEMRKNGRPPFGFGCSDVRMFGCSGFGKTRGEKLFSCETPSRLTVSRSAAAVPATQTEGPIARASAAHLGERRRVRPPRLRLGVERGDRALADVKRDAGSPGRARQFERARAGHDARREGQRAHERHRHLRAVKTSKRRNASTSRARRAPRRGRSRDPNA